ncbi:MAG: hydrogenase expression/formation protein HypE [Gammaproteobacteria bacterium]
MAGSTSSGPWCPLPTGDAAQVQLAHGGGGQLTLELVEGLFRPAFANRWLDAAHDGAVLELGGARVAFTTDSYVVRPLFFPGGDIGSLAVYGTVNDLAMCGARPAHLSVGFILEEGFPLDQLAAVVASMRDAAQRAGVTLVTGDTKVVERGHGHGVYVNTAGLGVVEHALDIGPAAVGAGDVLIVSGDIGRHGIAVMAAREGLDFSPPVHSDCAPLTGAVQALLAAGVTLHCLRDLTRGGLGAALVEIARGAGLALHVERRAVPVAENVAGACELLGLDPLFVANEGRMLVVVPAAAAEAALAVLHAHPDGAGAAVIGEVRAGGPAGRVTATSEIGTVRRLELPSGTQLPRIC